MCSNLVRLIADASGWVSSTFQLGSKQSEQVLRSTINKNPSFSCSSTSNPTHNFGTRLTKTPLHNAIVACPKGPSMTKQGWVCFVIMGVLLWCLRRSLKGKKVSTSSIFVALELRGGSAGFEKMCNKMELLRPGELNWTQNPPILHLETFKSGTEWKQECRVVGYLLKVTIVYTLERRG